MPLSHSYTIESTLSHQRRCCWPRDETPSNQSSLDSPLPALSALTSHTDSCIRLGGGRGIGTGQQHQETQETLEEGEDALETKIWTGERVTRKIALLVSGASLHWGVLLLAHVMAHTDNGSTGDNSYGAGSCCSSRAGMKGAHRSRIQFINRSVAKRTTTTTIQHKLDKPTRPRVPSIQLSR